MLYEDYLDNRLCSVDLTMAAVDIDCMRRNRIHSPQEVRSSLPVHISSMDNATHKAWLASSNVSLIPKHGAIISSPPITWIHRKLSLPTFPPNHDPSYPSSCALYPFLYVPKTILQPSLWRWFAYLDFCNL